MNIGILTFFKTTNYGAVLQCYALSHYLESNGNNVYLLDMPIPESTFLSSLYLQYFDSRYNKFVKSFLPPKRSIDNISDIDLFVVGSDQVWNPSITKTNHLSYFFDFVPNGLNKRFISYAASFGNDVWDFKHLNSSISNELKKFSNVSVRESSGVEICRNEFDISSQVVLDPVFLLSKCEYSRIFSLEEKERNNIVVYSLSIDDKIQAISGKLESLLNLKLDRLNKRYLNIHRDLGGFNRKRVSIQNWLNKMLNADIVITDSFHGVAFSIIFEKKFLVIAGNRTGRIQALLKTLGLENRFYDSTDQALKDLSWKEDIDYSLINTRLLKLQESSKRFLKDNF